ncbi:hypothetical protein D3C76_497590 [compost metagenome]
MGMGEHGQGFAAVQLQGELGGQGVEFRGVLQQREQLIGQWTGIQNGGRIAAGGGAEQQVAHIVGSGVARTEAGGQQVLHQLVLLLRAYATNLQVAAVGQLQHAAGAHPRGLGHGAGLSAGKPATGQLDPADAAVQRGHNAP